LLNDHIYKEARRIVRLYETRDPFKIAGELGIKVVYKNNFAQLKGMYKVIMRNRFIFLNGNMNEIDLRTVCAHELGHDRHHRDLAVSGVLQEFGLYDMRMLPEREANIFAAALLIDDESLFPLLKEEYTYEQIAWELSVNINLLYIKLDELRLQGYDVRVPYRPQSDFLRK
jgi:Zn-dependent peptidase ImmA (M78 family)